MLWILAAVGHALGARRILSLRPFRSQSLSWCRRPRRSQFLKTIRLIEPSLT
jgi:hypothetical protein